MNEEYYYGLDGQINPADKKVIMEEKSPKRRCRYGAECRLIQCKFYHPPTSSEADGVEKTKPKSTSEKNAAPKRDRSKIQCRYGMECRNTKCPFYHHPAAATSPPSSPTRATNNVVNGEKNQEYVPLSPPAHSASNGGKTKFATAPTSPSRKAATTKKKCRWGAGCRSKNCKFLHPGQKFDGEAAQKSKQKDAVDNKVRVPTKPVVRPILPPSSATQQPLGSVQNTSYQPPGLSFRSSDAPFQSTSVPIGKASTTTAEEVSRLNNMFRAAPAVASGLFTDESTEHKPLYFRSNAGEANGSPSGQPTSGAIKSSQPAADSQNQPPDANWLYDVLGLNDIGVNGSTTASQPKQYVKDVVDVVGDIHANINNYVGDNTPANSISHAPHDEEVYHTHTPESVQSPVVGADSPTITKADEISSKTQLINEDEIMQSRRAALELRLESQQNPYNPELLFTLLQTCRSKQEMIKTALEQSMDGEGGGEVDETNIVALLDLNELLVGAVDMAESSLRIAKNSRAENGTAGAKVAPSKSVPDKRVKGSKKKVKDSSWKSVDGKTATNKSKPTESGGKSKKSGKKTSQTSKAGEKKQEKKKAAIVPPQEKPAVDKSEPTTAENSVDSAQQEKEKMARMLEEARKQAAAARERKKSKKNKKHDRWMKQNEEAREGRAKLWSERIAKENDYIDLIEKLLVAEFLRQSTNKAMGLSAERVHKDTDASEVIDNECREAYHAIFEGQKCRVVVAGSENKDMNQRQGTVRYWDREKGKFCVGLDTKKSPDSDVQFLVPETLDALPPSRSSKTDKKKSSATFYDVNVPKLMSYGGIVLGLSFRLWKSHVIELGSAESTKIGLQAFVKSRVEEEEADKKQEEADKEREEEDRRRRAAQRARENSDWERRKEQKRRDKEEYDQKKKEWAKARREYGGSMFDYEDDDEECQCPRCQFRANFFSSGGAFSMGGMGGGFFFNIGGIPFRVGFDSYDSEEEDSDEFDEEWEERMQQEKEEEDRKQAEILGVDAEADERTIKLAYRKMALQFHPDKWKSDSDHGMPRKEAENRFKSIQNAYDHLMSNFDE